MLNHIVSVKQFLDKDQLNLLFATARRFEQMTPHEYPQLLKSRQVATLFYEPSTRTRLSFEAAVLNLGGGVISTENASVASSAVKGESLQDTIRVIGGYADVIVIRHKDPGSAELASRVSSVPIINAGDGGGEHPTQALLDLYTIIQQKGNVDGLKVGLAGDLLFSRTLHSLLYLLAIYNVELFLIAPKEVELPAKYLDYLKANKVKYHIVQKIEDCLPILDVVYINRLQLERHKTKITTKPPAITVKNLKLLKPDAIILNPLPRVDEIEVGVDVDSRAFYFQQARNGLYVRMALLAQLFKP